MAKPSNHESALLGRINGPEDLKSLPRESLPRLAEEIRKSIVDTVAETGGHLAPNLGVVELTIGLHLALDSPKDKIVWDVGHQCYTHKILTGRRDRFRTLRQHEGIAGFPKKSESPHDIFDSGHASSSISAGLGLAEARDKRGSDETIVVVIGDGSLTGGMAYEALNQAGHLGTRLIIVLNDNVMSISPNVGAMSSYLARIRLDPAYNKLRDDVEDIVKRIPAIGEIVVDVAEHLKDGFKQLVVPGMLFEELGLKYVGPIDGHDIDAVEESVRLAKQAASPVLIHALTKKGIGYEPAEREPERFHGTNPYVVSTGEPKKTSKVRSYTAVFGDTLVELAKENKKIVAVTAAMTCGTGLEAFSREFRDRFYDVGIAEQHTVTFSAGLALGGFLPVVAIYSTFLCRALDQVIQDVCLQGLHVVFCLDRAGLVGEDGPTHHGVYDLSYLRLAPGMTIMAPKDEDELRHMLLTAVKAPGPVAIRYPRGEGLGVELSAKLKEIPLGEAELVRKGKDVCFVAIGRMVAVAQEAADMVESEGLTASVINGRFAKPLDGRLIPGVAAGHQLVVTLEENALVGGFGSGVMALLGSTGVRVPVLVLGIPDEFVDHGRTDILLADAGLSPEAVASSALSKLAALRRQQIGSARG